MKNKRILYTFSSICFIVFYLASTSFSGGITGKSTTGCSCHGPASAATTITLSGAPASYTPGNTYTITATVNNAIKAAAGIDLTVSHGILGGTPIGAIITGLEMNHTTPNTMSGGMASWTFNWTAPAAGTGTTSIYVAGNAVDMNGNPNGDQYNIDSLFVTETTSTSTLSCSASIINPLCFGGTGNVTGFATGGTSPYSYNLISVGTNSTGFFPVVATGIYNLVITDALSNTCTTSVVVNNPSMLGVFTTNCSNVTCFGGTNGMTSGSAFGGTSPYTYLWMPSGVTTPIATGLMAGTHTLIVTDANGCTASANCTITQPPAITSTVTASAAVSYTLPGTSTVVTTTGVYTHIYMVAGACDSTVTYNVTIGSTCVRVSPKVMLYGPYNSGSLMMDDNLRTLGLIPLTEPYSTLSPYSSVYVHSSGGGETTTASVLAVAGPNAIVDWVFLTLRTTPTSAVVATRAALVQRDGDVVDVDGVSPVCFNAPIGNYHVSVKHRNHLGCMTASAFALSTTTTVVDFISPATIMWLRSIPPTNNPFPLSGARKNIGAKRLLYPGNVKIVPGFWNDRVVRWGLGIYSDRNYLFSTCSLPVLGYISMDCNMDGTGKWAGLGNDRWWIQKSCEFSSSVYAYEQLP
jgi:hypothetical protein